MIALTWAQGGEDAKVDQKPNQKERKELCWKTWKEARAVAVTSESWRSWAEALCITGCGVEQ